MIWQKKSIAISYTSNILFQIETRTDWYQNLNKKEINVILLRKKESILKSIKEIKINLFWIKYVPYN